MTEIVEKPILEITPDSYRAGTICPRGPCYCVLRPGERPTKLPDPVFADCVDSNPSSTLRVPYCVGGFIYATNGRIIVRCRSNERETEGFPPPWIPLSHWEDRSYVDRLVFVSEIVCKQNPCDTCNGFGRYVKQKEVADRVLGVKVDRVELLCPSCLGAGCSDDAGSFGHNEYRLPGDLARILFRHDAIVQEPLPTAMMPRMYRFQIMAGIVGLAIACTRPMVKG